MLIEVINNRKINNKEDKNINNKRFVFFNQIRYDYTYIYIHMYI